VRVSARLPAGVALLRGKRTTGARAVSFPLSGLGAHRTRTLRFRVRVRPRPGSRALQVTARARAAGDINPLDNFATDRTLLGHGPSAVARRPAAGQADAPASSDHALALAVARMRTLAGPRLSLPTLTEASQRFGALCRIVLS
jgi:hypothetical protein